MARMKKSHKIQEKKFVKDGFDYVLTMFKTAQSPLLINVVLIKKWDEPDTGGLNTVMHKKVYEKSFDNREYAHAVYQEILKRALDK